MATPTSDQLIRLAEAHRAEQIRRAAITAAFVAAAYRRQAASGDSAAVQRWLALVLPRVLSEHERSAELAARYANGLRKLQLGPTLSAYQYEPKLSLSAGQLSTSLRVVGPQAYLRKANTIREMDAPPVTKQALIRDAIVTAERSVAGATLRHVQNGGRTTTYEGQLADQEASGYVRVTRGKPCYFCVMLASRGVVYSEGSFDASDPRFTGEGNVKVHDSCQCSLQPIYRDSDPWIKKAREFEDMWREGSDGPGDAMKNFRRWYEGRTA